MRTPVLILTGLLSKRVSGSVDENGMCSTCLHRPLNKLTNRFPVRLKYTLFARYVWARSYLSSVEGLALELAQRERDLKSNPLALVSYMELKET